MQNTQILKKFSFFSDLGEEDLQHISEISVERSYRKNMLIFMEGEPGEAFYYVKSGKIKIFRTYEDGKEHIIHILNEGDVFGEATLFSGIPYPASASVYDDSVVGMIKNPDLEILIKQNSELALKLIRILAQKLVFSQQKIKDLTFNDVFARTAAQLLKLSKDYGRNTGKGVVVDIKLSRQELADMVGTTRETVSRVVGAFKKEKLLAEEDDKIVILNCEKLESRRPPY